MHGESSNIEIKTAAFMTNSSAHTHHTFFAYFFPVLRTIILCTIVIVAVKFPIAMFYEGGIHNINKFLFPFELGCSS